MSELAYCTDMFMRAAADTYVAELIAKKTDKIAASYRKPLTPKLISRAARRAQIRVANMLLSRSAESAQQRPSDRDRLNKIVLLSVQGHGSEIDNQTIWAETKDPRLLKLQGLIREILPRTLVFSEQAENNVRA